MARRLGLCFAAILLASGCTTDPDADSPAPIDLGPHMSQPCELLTTQLRRSAGINGEPEPGHVNFDRRASCAAFNDAPHTSGAPALSLTLSKLGDRVSTFAQHHPSAERFSFQGYPAALWSRSSESNDNCEVVIDVGPKDGITVTAFTRHDARPSPCDLAKKASATIIDQLRTT